MATKRESSEARLAAGLKRQAEAEGRVRRDEAIGKLQAALLVMLLNEGVRSFLELSDPKAIEQALAALEASGYAGETHPDLSDHAAAETAAWCADSVDRLRVAVKAAGIVISTEQAESAIEQAIGGVVKAATNLRHARGYMQLVKRVEGRR